jgi:MFS transporter, DHA1 family, inner membrane transport protein
MHYLILLLAGATFTSGLSGRATEPVITAIASEYVVAITTVALLSSAFAFTFAMVQPVMGVVAERFGKPRVISVCLLLVAIGNLAAAFAPSFPILLVSRVVCGAGAGGIVPIILAFVADRVAFEQRQVTMSRILAGTLSGQLIGAALSGVIGDLVGWRGVFLVIGCLVLISAITVTFALRNQAAPANQTTGLRALFAKYRVILSHPNAPVCYLSVLCEGALIQGLFPYVSSFVAETGVKSFTIAGFVLAGFAIGGLLYSTTVSFLLRLIGRKRLMIVGGVLVCAMLWFMSFTPPWQIQMAAMAMLGFGFFMTHGAIQMFATEIAPDARAMATSLHAFSLFSGQMLGPILYGIALSHFGKTPSLLAAGLGFLLIAVVSSARLRHDSAKA